MINYQNERLTIHSFFASSKQMEISFLKSILKLNHVTLSAEQINQLCLYHNLTQKWAQSINITKNLSNDDFARENILDPMLAYIKWKPCANNNHSLKLIDVGCGGGFVGIIFKIMSGDKFHLTLLDSDRKRTNFCRQALLELKLTNATVIQEKMELCKTKKFDLITMRATFKFEEFTEKVKPMCHPQTQLLHFTGKEALPNTLALEYQILPWNIKRILTLKKGSVENRLKEGLFKKNPREVS